MSKKNSSVILKNGFKNYEDLSSIYSDFKKKLSTFKNKKFLVAVSGGPDSLALTALTKAYSYENKSKIYYVLVDHNLRRNSAKEAHSVKKLLKKNSISINILKNKISVNKNIQSKAREIRYNLLVSFCKKKKIKTILTAHNLEDQVETFFIRLSRGSGLHGLSSMKQTNKISGNINLVRPFLDIKKIQLIKISKIIFGKYYKDPTNKDTKYLRTRIRSLKISLEKSGVKYEQIIKSIKNLASSRDTLDLYFNRIYEQIVDFKNNKLLIKKSNFAILNDEMKMRVLQQSIKNLTNTYYFPRTKKILRLIEQIKVSKDLKVIFSGCVILFDKNRIILKKQRKK